ncbi:MAG: AraC family transcriptional regulator [Pseudomonadota bacterium]
MPHRYQDIYPEQPLLKSADLDKPSAMDLLSMEFFEAKPGEMPHEVFSQHHILVNLRDKPHRVENWRDDKHRDFTYHKNEIVVTPAGVKSGWKWYAKSKVIVITLEPDKLEKFAQSELGILLTDTQLKDVPQFVDEDITQAAVMLMDALKSDVGSAVMFESFARIFLTKLIQKYGLERGDDIEFSKSFTSKHYKRVLDYIAKNYGQNIALEHMAAQAGISLFHFMRLFKQMIGQSPHQFVMTYRVEQAKKMLTDLERPMIDIAHACGFSDQAHFSRVFKQIQGDTPKQWRQRSIQS